MTYNNVLIILSHNSPTQKKLGTSSPWGDSKMHRSGSIEFDEFGSTEDANWNKQKWHYNKNKDLTGKWYSQTLKTLRIIYSEMEILLLILSWWCFSCPHFQRIVMQYKDQLFLKINSLGTIDI